MTIAQGERVRLRKLVREDVDKMQHWGKHADPLFFHYNFPELDKKEGDEWFQNKTTKFRKKCFAIENEKQRLIGYLSIRDIKWIKRESELGIVLDPDYINQGYGTEAIRLFLKYYFGTLKMESILLRTAKYNKRAIQCYLNCGFQIVQECEEEFEDQYNEIFFNPIYKALRKIFCVVDGKKMTTYLHMRLSRDEYFHKINSLSTEIAVKCE